MPTSQQIAALEAAARAAFAAEQITQSPCELAVAQRAIESSWGGDAPGNNSFGIKSYPSCADRQLLATHEWFTGAEVHQFLALADQRPATLVLDGRRQPVTNGNRKRYRAMD